MLCFGLEGRKYSYRMGNHLIQKPLINNLYSIKKYRDLVTPQKKGCAPEARRLERLLKDKGLMPIKLQNALPNHFDM